VCVCVCVHVHEICTIYCFDDDDDVSWMISYSSWLLNSRGSGLSSFMPTSVKFCCVLRRDEWSMLWPIQSTSPTAYETRSYITWLTSRTDSVGTFCCGWIRSVCGFNRIYFWIEKQNKMQEWANMHYKYKQNTNILHTCISPYGTHFIKKE